MPRLILLIVLPVFLAGCRFAVVPMPNGKVAYVGSLLTDPHWTRAQINLDGSVVLEGYDSRVNAEATRSVVAGVVQGLLKTVVPIP